MHRIVDLHDGWIKVESEVGAAHALSCVFRSLRKPGLGCGMKEGNRGKILVVDDEQGCAMC